VCKAHRLLYHSTLGCRVIKKKTIRPTVPGRVASAGVGVWGFLVRVSGSGFRVPGSVFGFRDVGCMSRRAHVQLSRPRVASAGVGVRVSGFGIGVSGFGFRNSDCGVGFRNPKPYTRMLVSGSWIDGHRESVLY